MEKIVRVDPLKQYQLQSLEQEKLLEQLNWLLSMPCGTFFAAIKYHDVVQAAFTVAKLRK